MKLADILSANLCSGCGLCASILGPERASMQLAQPGFLRPHLTGEPTAAEEALIARVCPGSTVHLPAIVPGQAGSPEWGPVRRAATGHATDEALRHRASSGGALSAILKHLLAEGRARYVLHVSASADTPWLNRQVRSDNADGVADGSGSRYAPSAPLADIIARLGEGLPFVVVGKPCDIAALRAYASFDPRVDELVVAMVAFMCGGVPSETGIRDLVRHMGADPADVTAFRFRGQGWPGRATATLRDGREVSLSYAESWGDVLSKHVQVRCKLCADGNGMSADIVCADAWYGDERGYPAFDEQDGRSLILARTPRGEAIIAAAEASGLLAAEPVAMTDVDRMQPFQLRRTRLTLSRLLALKAIGQRTTRYTGTGLWRHAAREGLVKNVKSFLGAVRRGLSGRL
jgi:coenzyme F420 hydrogenase subunit beta